MPLLLFHDMVVVHVAFVTCMRVNDAQLSLSLVYQLTLLRLKHEVQDVRRVVTQLIQS